MSDNVSRKKYENLKKKAYAWKDVSDTYKKNYEEVLEKYNNKPVGLI